MKCCARQAEQVSVFEGAGWGKKEKGRAAEAGKATRLILRPRGMGQQGAMWAGRDGGRCASFSHVVCCLEHWTATARR